jgi:hypothetical protein
MIKCNMDSIHVFAKALWMLRQGNEVKFTIDKSSNKSKYYRIALGFPAYGLIETITPQDIPVGITLEDFIRFLLARPNFHNIILAKSFQKSLKEGLGCVCKISA